MLSTIRLARSIFLTAVAGGITLATIIATDLTVREFGWLAATIPFAAGVVLVVLIAERDCEI